MRFAPNSRNIKVICELIIVFLSILGIAHPASATEPPQTGSSEATKEWKQFTRETLEDRKLVNHFVARFPGTPEADAAIVARYLILNDAYLRVKKASALDDEGGKKCQALIEDYEDFIKTFEQRAIHVRAMFDLFDLSVKLSRDGPPSGCGK